MIPNNHSKRSDLVYLRDKLYELIDSLKLENKRLNILLDQDVLCKTDELLNLVCKDIDRSDFIIKAIHEYDRYKFIESIHCLKARTSERTYWRDLGFSLFHRSISPNCPVIDLDFLEIRKTKDGLFKPVLIYDVKMGQDLLKNIDKQKNKLLSLKVYLDVANKLNIPFWLVGYERWLKYLDIYYIDSINPLQFRKERKTPVEFKGLIESL